MDQEPKIQKIEQELSSEGRKIIELFQKAQKTLEPAEREVLLGKFVRQLVLLLETKEGKIAETQRVPPILLTGQKKYFGDDCVYLGAGTAGQRIFFNDSVIIYDDPRKAEQLGKDAIIERLTKETLLKSTDGKPRWMVYHFPEGSDQKFGIDFWSRFIQNFGGEIVDLLQRL